MRGVFKNAGKSIGVNKFFCVFFSGGYTSMMNHLQESSGYLDLGMPLEAWEVLEHLPPEQRALPEVLSMRVRIYLAMGKRDESQVVANGMVHRYQQSGHSWLSLARVMAVSGRPRKDVSEALEKCFRLNRALRLEALDDPLLDGFW